MLSALDWRLLLLRLLPLLLLLLLEWDLAPPPSPLLPAV